MVELIFLVCSKNVVQPEFEILRTHGFFFSFIHPLGYVEYIHVNINRNMNKLDGLNKFNTNSYAYLASGLRVCISTFITPDGALFR